MAAEGAQSRVNFSANVVRETARKAMYICSNPGCLRVTGFLTTGGKPRAIAQAAHILPAATKGPRRDAIVTLPDGSELQQGDERNAIWLCLGCHYIADADPEGFSADLLLTWKREHENRVASLVGLDLEQSLLKLGGERRFHDLARELLLWLDGHRFMYFDDAREMPDYVWRAIDALRVKLTELRARTDSDSALGQVLTEIDSSVHDFIKALNDVRVDEIAVTDGNPEFEIFSRALRALRSGIQEAIWPLARDQNFNFKNIRSS